MREINYGPVANPDGTPSEMTIAMLGGTGRLANLYRVVFKGYAFDDRSYSNPNGSYSNANLDYEVEGEFKNLGDVINYCMGEYGDVPMNFGNLSQVIVNIEEQGKWLISFSDDKGREMIHTATLTI